MPSSETSPEGVISATLDRMLDSRAYPKTICPSEVARALPSQTLEELGVTDWRDVMSTVRRLAYEKAAAQQVEVLQGGIVADVTSLEALKGPIRLRKPQ